MNNEIIVTDGDSPLISQPSPVLVGGEPSVVVQENFVGGQNATIQIGSVETLPAGSQAYVTNVGTETHGILNFGLVTGNTGESGSDGSDGSDGTAATIQVGTVTTGLPNTNASVTNVGTENAAILDFTIPQGIQGLQGIQGVAGVDGISPRAYVEQISGGARVVIEDSETTTTADIMDGVDGTDGTDGFSPIATVTQNTGSATISIQDSQGTTTATVYDGQNGTNGVTPVITATASVDSSTGTPSVSVYKTGTDEYPQFDFAFEHLKGADGTTPSVSEIALTDYISLNTGYSLADSNVQVYGKICIIHLNVSATNAFTSTQSTIGQIKSGYRPKSLINGFASLSGGQWSRSGDTCYCYVQTNGNIIIADHQNTNKKWVSIMLTYALN